MVVLEEVNKPSYYPFKSKEELMLYVLINSPIPIVSHCCVYIVIHLICALQAEKVHNQDLFLTSSVTPLRPRQQEVSVSIVEQIKECMNFLDARQSVLIYLLTTF